MQSACPALEVPGSEWSHEPLLSRASSKVVQHAERKSSPHVHLPFLSVQPKIAGLPQCLLHLNLQLRCSTPVPSEGMTGKAAETDVVLVGKGNLNPGPVASKLC